MMAGLKKLFQKFSTQMDLYALVVLLAFFFMVRPVEEIKDIQISGDGKTLYLALGKQGVRVLDISDPGNPTEVGKYDTFNSANALAVRTQGEDEMLFVADGKSGVLAFEVSEHENENSQKTIDLILKWDDKSFEPAIDITIIDKFAWIARDDEGLTIVKIDELPPQNDKKWTIEGLINAQKVVVHNKKVYVVDGDWNLKIFTIDNKGNYQEKGSTPLEVPINDIFVHNSVAYLATDGKGLVLADVKDPNNISIVFAYEEVGTSLNSVSVNGSFAFIGAGGKGLQILDISHRNEIITAGKTEDGEIGIAQKIFWHSDYIYLGDGIAGLKTIKINIDVDVKNLETAASLSLGQQSKVVDSAISKEKYAYLAGGDRGLWVLDISDPDKPSVYPFYDDDIRDYASAVISRGEYIYAAYQKKGLAIYTPGAQKSISKFDGEGEYLDLAMVDDNYLFVAAGSAGLRVLNVSSFITQVTEDGIQDTPGNAVGLFVLDNHAYVADSAEGLQIINVLDPKRPALIKSINTNGDTRAVYIHKHRANESSPERLYAYIADGSNGLVVHEVSNPYEPREIIRVETQEFTQDVFGKGNKLYVAERAEGLIVYDISNPENPIRQGTETTSGEAVRITLEGDYVYVADDNRGLKIINITNPDEPILTGSYDIPSDVKDVIIQGNEFYMVDGKEGMWLMSLGNSMLPFYKSFILTPGEAKNIELGNGKAYVADGSKGLQVIDLTNPISLTILGSFGALDDVNDVKVDSTYAYIANGFGGMSIATITDTLNIKQVGHFGTQGAAMAIDISGKYAFIVTTEGRLETAYLSDIAAPPRVQPPTPFHSVLKDTQNIRVANERAYILDGENGLVVYDVSKPFNPVLVFRFDTPGQVKDIAFVDHYAFLADGTSGIEMLYLPEYNKRQPVANYLFDDSAATKIKGCSADAQSVAVHSRQIKQEDEEKIIHFFVYVAAGECGLIPLDYSIKVVPQDLDLYITPGEASIGRVIKDYGNALKTTLIRIYARRSEAPIFLIVLQEYVGQFGSIHPTVVNTAILFAFGAFLLTVGLLFWMALAANFVLPVKTGTDGWQSFWRLFLYFRGMHGPIEFAREGQRLTSDSTQVLPDRPGVVRVDLNSAVVIEEYPASWFFSRRALRRLQRRRRRDGANLFQTRAEGPGVVFLRSFERVRGFVDLRPQFRGRIRVHANTRDGIELYSNFVFAGFSLGEKPDVLFITYDGEEIAENLKVLIRQFPRSENEELDQFVEKITDLSDELDLDDKRDAHRFIQRNRGRQVSFPVFQQPTQRRNPPFIFDAERIFNAVSSRPYDVSESQISEWTELPAHAAAGLFRNLISSELFDQISKPTDPDDFPLTRMRGILFRRLRNMGVLAYQYVENLDGSPITVGQTWNRNQLYALPVQEFRPPKPLRARGIRIRFSGFTELIPRSRAVSHQLIDYWRSEWQKDATIIEADHDLQAMRIRNLARKQAQSDLVNTLSMILSDSSYTQEALTLRVLQALETAAADPETRRLLPRDTALILRNLRQLLLP